MSAAPAFGLERGDPARVRARQTADERIDHVIHLMAMGWWDGARTTRELATEWGCTSSAVNEYARVASATLVRISAHKREELVAITVAGVDKLRIAAEGAAALGSVKAVAVALSALDLRSRLLGIFPKTEIAITVDAPDMSCLTDEELDAAVRIMAKVKANAGGQK